MSSSKNPASVMLRSTTDADRLRESGSPYLDVRTPAEFAAGHPPKAINVDFLGASSPEDFIAQVEKALPAAKADGKPIVIGCKSGGRSARAAAALAAAGYNAGGILIDVQGGFDAWLSQGLPVEK
jgi:rhodanese-related sulfurtransferase